MDKILVFLFLLSGIDGCPNHRYNNKYQHDTCQSCFGPQIPQGHAAYGAVVFGYPGIIPLLPDYRATKDRCDEYQE